MTEEEIDRLVASLSIAEKLALSERLVRAARVEEVAARRAEPTLRGWLLRIEAGAATFERLWAKCAAERPLDEVPLLSSEVARLVAEGRWRVSYGTAESDIGEVETGDNYGQPGKYFLNGLEVAASDVIRYYDTRTPREKTPCPP